MPPDLITIYSTPGCGWAIRNYAALIEKGIPFTIVMAKEADGRKRDEFLALSPYARTPVMSVNGDVVWDSLHMNYFIDELFPEPALMPESPVERAQARLWMRHCDHELFPVVSGLKGVPDNDAGERVRTGLEQLLDHGFPDHDSGDLWMGSRIGLVDMCYATLFDALDVISQLAGTDWLDVPRKLRRWRNAIIANPAMQQARSIPESLSLVRPTLTVNPHAGGKFVSNR